ncbi:threonine synthase [Escherichia coli]|uniref:Threonine synthase n=1 Tax=Escherichia coli TaxID=562 RepID=A0A2X1P8J5_ECOLX|nr:threonine synthase [Escherichia coli]
MLKLDFVTRSAKILSAFIGDEIPQEILEERVRAAFAFPAPVANVESDVGCLELFPRAQRWHLKISAVALWHKC